jgi:hypothetical protein
LSAVFWLEPQAASATVRRAAEATAPNLASLIAAVLQFTGLKAPIDGS